MHPKTLFFLFAILTGSYLWADEPSITASCLPSEITTNESASYVVTIQGSGAPNSIHPPRVEGLEITPRGTEQSYQLINGTSSSQRRYRFLVYASTPGNYTIPEYTVQLSKKEYTVPSATLNVQPAGTASQGQGMGLYIRLPEDPIYVGQVVPVVVDLEVPRSIDASVADPYPLLQGNAFADQGFTIRPESSAFMRGQEAYAMVRWKTAVIPEKTGPQSLAYNLALAVTTEATDHEFQNNPFAAFMGSMFTEQREVVLATQPTEIQVQPLPAGAPNNFTGAIGEFSLLSASLDAEQGVQGEPIELTVQIQGTGNFDHFQAPELSATDGWKIYPPQAKFTPGPLGSFSGTLSLSYIIIPQSQNSDLQVPNFLFSYYNPRVCKYSKLRTNKQSLKILPATPSVQPSSIPSNLPSVDQVTSPFSWLDTSLNLIASLRNWIYIALGVIALIYLLNRLFRSLKKRALLPEKQFRALQSKSLSASLKAAEKALTQNDPPTFWNAVQTCIRWLSATPSTPNPEALSHKEVLHSSHPDNKALATLYETCEKAHYGAQPTDTTTSKSALKLLHSALKNL